MRSLTHSTTDRGNATDFLHPSRSFNNASTTYDSTRQLSQFKLEPRRRAHSAVLANTLTSIPASLGVWFNVCGIRTRYPVEGSVAWRLAKRNILVITVSAAWKDFRYRIVKRFCCFAEGVRDSLRS